MGTQTFDERHPRNTGPDYRDDDGYPARVVVCPNCGQMEWWTEAECADHGLCRTTGTCECTEDEEE